MHSLPAPSVQANQWGILLKKSTRNDKTVKIELGGPNLLQIHNCMLTDVVIDGGFLTRPIHNGNDFWHEKSG